ncbi:TRAP transporter large permease [Palleronia abyssalis]|uniref:TRAP transporter large permease protein n=1 Tax=Palleronia abyssalis TaxID=1501240 RepID=A0A2R8BZ62_9RHOB|nr:TRAP transporter large permease [Palleronia abyssalis]SPJ25403.1 C4-dicarboxylate TRAP transporter large permease protein DctM [Palleronia abyssalis]
MTNVEIGLTGLAVLIILIGLRVPIAIALFSVPFAGIYAMFGWRPALGALKVIPYDFAASWELSSIPMFLLMGYLAYHTGITAGLFDAARVWLARLPGGLAIASIFGASGFAAVTGSSVATAAAMGKIAVPEMQRHGYDPRLSTGTVAAAGTIGALIPPSILLILYGIIAEVPINKLFLGGAGVGLLSAFAYVLVVIIWVKLRPDVAPRSDESHTMRERLTMLRKVLPALLLAFMVFGGLFAGLFTPTEAGAVGAALCTLIAAGQRKLTMRNFRISVGEAFATTSALLFIVIGANLLARFVALSGVDAYIADVVAAVSSSTVLFLLGIVTIYLVLGMFLEPTGAMIITLPIVLPVASTLGVNELWFGIFLAKILEVGMITPPIGLNVFVLKNVVDRSISLGTIFKGTTWFLVADMLVLVTIVLVPAFVLLLPGLL